MVRRLVGEINTLPRVARGSTADARSPGKMASPGVDDGTETPAAMHRIERRRACACLVGRLREADAAVRPADQVMTLRVERAVHIRREDAAAASYTVSSDDCVSYIRGAGGMAACIISIDNAATKSSTASTERTRSVTGDSAAREI